ncbi:ROK family transcriptional regulator [Streptomyces sp. NPDC020807]|uniref:ROK family transcriptional regulator n=1 Tax=Streptomyces sp. NPDC020807 TaxID=3155119 RepID=UPI0033D325D2
MSTPPVPLPATARLLSVVHRYGPLSRAEATNRSGLARSAAGVAAERLAAAGLIELGEHRTAGLGRPSVTLTAAEDGPAAVGVKIEPTGVRAVCYALGGRREATHTDTVPLLGMAPDEIAARIADAADVVLGDRRERCVGIVLAFPGMVDPLTGTVLTSLSLGWEGPVPLASLVGEAVDARLPGLGAAIGTAPVSLVRDSSATAVGLCGERPGERTLVVVGEYDGVGAALMGADGDAEALELGHVPVDPAGAPCRCGARGCLELFVSDEALAPVLIAHESGEGPAALEPAAERLGVALVGALNTVGPRALVLTGLLGQLAVAVPHAVDRALAASVAARVRGTAFRVTQDPDAAVRGAAELALRPLLDDPSRWRRPQRAG